MVDIDLVHGWIVEANSQYYSLLESLSYDQIQEKLVQFNSLHLDLEEAAKKSKTNKNNNNDPNNQLPEQKKKILFEGESF